MIESDVYETAADWHGRLDGAELTPGERARFEAWLAADPRHESAYRSIERMWSTMGAAAGDPLVAQFSREALAAGGGRSIRMARPRLGRTQMRLMATAAAIAVVMGAAYVAAPALRGLGVSVPYLSAADGIQKSAYGTGVGEQSAVTLSDGSSVVLNTDSRIEVVFTKDRRGVRLLSGQAWFEVAKNASRPFVVEAGEQRITALGTAFDVRVYPNGESVRVTLAEGRVAVEPVRTLFERWTGAQPSMSELAPGEALVVSAAQPAVKHTADVARVASWREGKVILDNDTLGDAIREINRYSTTEIVLRDPALAALRVSGVFKTGHSRSFVETVTGHYPIAVVDHSAGRIVLGPRR